MKCKYCEDREATETHHIFMGHGMRPISDEYRLTIDLCRVCHQRLHFNTGSKRQTQIELCERIGIDKSLFVKLNQILHRNAKYWSNKDLNFMVNVKYFLENREVANENADR